VARWCAAESDTVIARKIGTTRAASTTSKQRRQRRNREGETIETRAHHVAQRVEGQAAR